MAGDAQICALAEMVLTRFRDAGLQLATAESCTGGLIAAALTDIAGSSDVLDRGFVTYSNEAKQEMLEVPETLIAEFGAVSAEVAAPMAIGALEQAGVDAAVAVTGIAGPGGGRDEKPVGLVFIAVAVRGAGVFVEEHRFGDLGRSAVRRATVIAALEMLASYATPQSEQ